MKSLFTIISIALCLWSNAQCVVNAPYLSDFETGGVIDPCLTQDPAAPLDWFAYTGSTPTTSSGPSGAHNGNYFIYIESSSPVSPNDSAIIYTPHINTTNLNAPALYFHYHMYGNDYMQLRVDYQIIGSNNWQTVFSQTGSPQQQTTDPYELIYIPLLDAVDTLIQVRFVGITGANDGVSTSIGTAWRSDIAIDYIRVEETIVDELAITNLIVPKNSCGLGMETIEVELMNIGSQLQDSITVVLEWNNTNSLTYALPNPIPGNFTKDTAYFNVDLSTTQSYNFTTYILNNNDNFDNNDTISNIETYTHPIINAITPHINDFENGSTGWYGTGDWEFGQPNNIVISNAASGQNAFATGLTSNYTVNTTSYLYSPGYFFEDSINPVLKFDINWEIEDDWDAAWLEYSIDNGSNWAKLEDNGTAQNWYTDSIVQYPIGWAWNGTGVNGSGGWINTTFNLYPFRFDTIPYVRFRFVLQSDISVGLEGLAIDNINIIDSCYTLTLNPQIGNPTFDVLNNGTVILNATGGGGDYTYDWSHGVQGDYLDDLTAGNYTITITDFNGCTGIGVLSLINVCSDSMSVDFTTDNVIIDAAIQDTTLGMIQITVNNAVPPYTYTWNTGDTTAMLTNLNSGTYSVTVVDANSCITSGITTIDTLLINNIDLINSLQSFQFYPNPVRDALNLQLEFSNSVDLRIRVFDLHGRELMFLSEKNTTNYNEVLDFSTFLPSIYILHIMIDDKVITKQILITK